MRVRLIPTGQAELLGLAQCLGRLFPTHTFETVPAREEPDGRKVPFDGFTSARLRSATDIGSRLPRLVQQLASEVHPGRRGERADLALLIDDLELENTDQPAIVVAAVREAVRRHVDGLAQRTGAATVQRVVDALRERASFHLAAPMIEAWFFADPSVLPAAGVPLDRLPPLLQDGVDPEAFATEDVRFSADDGACCAALAVRNAGRPSRTQRRPPWLLPVRADLPAYRRERHPKAYLSWLCRDPDDDRCSTYRESSHGASALRSLGWARMLAAPSHARFARCIVQDLAEALGPPAIALPDGDEHPLLATGSAGLQRVLRNV
jgi:hypothetical protein